MFACVAGMFLLATTVVRAQPVLVDTRGGVEVWSMPQASPGQGYLATKVVLRAADENARLVTFENLSFGVNEDRSAPVQTWLSGLFGTPTAKNVAPGPTFPEDWIPVDSHLLISSMPPPTMIGGEAGNGFTGITEENDMSLGQIEGLSDVQGTFSTSGIGQISMVESTDAFFLDTDFQLREIDLAYLVGTEGAVSVPMSLGVLGEGIVNSGDPGGAAWGFADDALHIPFVPEPGSVSLLAMGALMFVGLIRRRK